MTVRYERSARILDVPMTQFRDVLRTWMRTQCAMVSTVSSAICADMHPASAASLIDEAEAQGLFGYRNIDVTASGHIMVQYDPTQTGQALLSATPMLPVPREKVAPILEALIERAGRLNARKGIPFFVEKIWLFGSFMRGASHVNDVDVCVETSTRPEWDALNDADKWNKTCEIVAEEGLENIVYRNAMSRGFAEEILRDRLVCGTPKPKRLSLVGLSNLMAMGCPCKLVFDRDRNGPVNDPILARHPASPGRSNHMTPPAVMPDLVKEGLLRPCGADLIPYPGDALRFLLPKPNPLKEREGERDWRVHIPEDTYPLRPKDEEVELWLNSVKGSNARERAAFVFGTRGHGGGFASPPLGMVVDRKIVARDNAYDYGISISETWTKQGGQWRNSKIAIAAACLTALAGIDVEKVARHAASLGRKQTGVSISIAAVDDPAAEAVAAMLRAALAQAGKPYLSGYAKKQISLKTDSSVEVEATYSL